MEKEKAQPIASTEEWAFSATSLNSCETTTEKPIQTNLAHFHFTCWCKSCPCRSRNKRSCVPHCLGENILPANVGRQFLNKTIDIYIYILSGHWLMLQWNLATFARAIQLCTIYIYTWLWWIWNADDDTWANALSKASSSLHLETHFRSERTAGLWSLLPLRTARINVAPARFVHTCYRQVLSSKVRVARNLELRISFMWGFG